MEPERWGENTFQQLNVVGEPEGEQSTSWPMKEALEEDKIEKPCGM